MIALTIARLVGFSRKGRLDSVWETYFTVVTAEIGLTLVAVTAFRALYVSKAKNRNVHKTITTLNWYQKGRGAVLGILSKATRHNYTDRTGSDKKEGRFIMNDIPNGTMTGLRTMINENGQSFTSSNWKEEV
jgi:hypothetical protein